MGQSQRSGSNYQPSLPTSAGLAPVRLRKQTPRNGAAVLLREDRFEILIGVPGMARHEALALRHGAARLGFVRLRDALVLVGRFEGFGPTIEAAIDRRAVPRDRQGPPPRRPGFGHTITLYGIDTRLGIIRAVRALTLPVAFSDELDGQLIDIDANATTAGWCFHSSMSELHRCWPDADELLDALGEGPV